MSSLQVFLFSSLLCTLIVLLLKWIFSYSKSHKNLPPSPPKLPIIGNLHQLGSSPHRALQTMAQSYGPLMLIHLGTVPVLVASSADAAKEIMKTHDAMFLNRPHLNIQNILFYEGKDIAFTKYGEYWRQVKSIAVLHLLSNKRVLSYQHVRDEEMTLMIEKIQRANGSVVNLSELLFSLINNVVCRVTLGRSYQGRKFKNMLEKTVELLGSFSVGSYIPSLKWVDKLSGLEDKAHKVAKEFDEFLEGVIDEHLNNKDVGLEGRDLVDILLDFQRDKAIDFRLERDMIKAIIMDLFTAGTDTTFATLEWAITELSRHPQVLNELRREVLETGKGKSLISEENLAKMPYLKAVIKETLRLHAPIPLIPRESTEDTKLHGYDIQSGTQVFINTWAIARDPSIWEEPGEFKPERFLNSDIDYKGFHFELIPFGAGRRGCPGIKFAVVVNQLVLANLVYKFNFKLLSQDSLDISETNGITVHKKYPLLVSATPCS